MLPTRPQNDGSASQRQSAAAVLGVVGAGGLGQLLAFHMGLFQMGKTATILGAMLLMVVLVDALSYLWRRALMR